MPNIKSIFLFTLLVLGTVALAACGGTPPPQGWSSPVIDNGLVYFGSTLAKVTALDVSTGARKWQFPAEGSNVNLVSVYSTPAVDNGTVYFGAYDNYFYALNPDLTPKWSQPFNVGAPVVSSPLVANNMVYFGANNNRLYALDAATGVEKWKIATQDKVWSDPVLDNGILYFGSLGKVLYAVDAANGNIKWTYPAGGMIVSTPLVSNGAVYFGSLNKFIALDEATGNKKWEQVLSEPNEWIWADPTTRNGVIYFGTLAGKVYALDAATGSPKWTQPFVAGGQIRSAVVIQDNIGYFGSSDQKIYALDLDTGQPRWNAVPLVGPVYASPALQGNTLYVATHGYNMYALNANDGTRIWCYDSSTNQMCPPQ